MRDHLELLTKAAALFSVGLIVLSIFHEIGFYAVVGKEFRHLVSTGDYLTNAISWIPETIYFLFIGVVLMFVFDSTRVDFAYHFPGQPLPQLWAEKWARRLYYLTLVVGSVAIVVGPPEKFLVLYPVLAWFVFFAWFVTIGFIIRNVTFLSDLPRIVRISLALIPIFCNKFLDSGSSRRVSADLRSALCLCYRTIRRPTSCLIVA